MNTKGVISDEDREAKREAMVADSFAYADK